MSKKLVKAFNALSRHPKAPSGLVPNEWHFDIRYIQIEPTPSHVLFLLQPESQFVHLERLPLGLPTGASGIEFFPESGKEAAPEVAKSLLHSFINKLGGNGAKDSVFGAPWKLSTEDKDLADAVGDEFKRLGLRAEALWKIDVAPPRVNDLARTVFINYFETLKKTIGLTGFVAAAIAAPDSIVFSTLKIDGKPSLCLDVDSMEDKGFALALNYVQLLATASPPMEIELDTKLISTQQLKQVEEFKLRLVERPEAVVRAEADDGNPEAALEYGLRLYIGVGCPRNRTLSRVYFFKALSARTATDTLKATVHGLLIDWYFSALKDSMRARYLYAACHHANISARLGRLISPKAAPASPAILHFMIRTFEPLSRQVPDLYYFYKDAVRAMEERTEYMRAGGQKMQVKRMNQPHRYRCATPGCGIEADSGSMLSKCGGSCDVEKKPHYCSKKCQKADWKNHKPFCRPGAECSIIDTGDPNLTAQAGPKTKSGALRVPVQLGDGSTRYLSSSTLDPEVLREMAALSVSGVPKNLTIEINRVGGGDDSDGDGDEDEESTCVGGHTHDST